MTIFDNFFQIRLWFSTRFSSDCVVPENISTPITEGIRNSEEMGGGSKEPGNSGGEGGLDGQFAFQMPFYSV